MRHRGGSKTKSKGKGSWLGVRTPLFWNTPVLHKEGILPVCAKQCTTFLYKKDLYMTPPQPPDLPCHPLSEILDPPLETRREMLQFNVLLNYFKETQWRINRICQYNMIHRNGESIVNRIILLHYHIRLK